MPQFYCPGCDCVIDMPPGSTAPIGCVVTTGDGTETTNPDSSPTGTTNGQPAGSENGSDNGNSSFGIAPFGLGLGDFFKDMCKLLPAGLCDLIKKIIVIIIVVVLIMAAMKVYKTFKK